jgi:uncharacterized membrane protein
MRAFIVTLALAGMIVSSLALRTHYAESTTSTLSSSHWNSSFVNHSSYSAVAGIPVATFGIVGYATVGILAFFRRRTLTSVFSLFGLAYPLYLTDIEAHRLNMWCVYCVCSLAFVTLITMLAFGQLIFGQGEV